MAHRIVQPSKEQVRAYMRARVQARRPPPSPSEIRKLLGWRMDTEPQQILLAGIYQIPTEYSQVLARLVWDWWAMRALQLCTFGSGSKQYFNITRNLK